MSEVESRRVLWLFEYLVFELGVSEENNTLVQQQKFTNVSENFLEEIIYLRTLRLKNHIPDHININGFREFCFVLFWSIGLINTLRPRQNGRHFPDDIFKWIFLNENVWISINISLNFVPRGPINNIPTLVQVMAWRRPGDKPLSEPMMVRLPTHIYVTRPQGVNSAYWIYYSFLNLSYICHFQKSSLMFQGLSVIDQIGIIEVGDHCLRNDLPHRRRDDPGRNSHRTVKHRQRCWLKRVIKLISHMLF